MSAIPQLLKYLDVFHELCDEEKNDLSKICKPVSIAKKSKFVECGNQVDYVFVIASGLIRWYIYSDNGEENNVFLVSEKDPPVILGVPEFYGGDKFTKYTIEAVVDTQLLVFPKSCFEELAFRHKGIYQYYIKSLKTIIDTLRKRTEQFCVGSPSSRYQTFLKERSFVAQHTNIKHLATFLGITPNSLSRLTARLYKKIQPLKK